MLVIGITGPTGCGKTTLLREIEHRGGYIVDCDALYYALLASEEGAALRQELQAAFPAAFDADGTLRRKALGRLVFGDPSRMAQLNEIVFFHVGNAVRARLVHEQSAGRQLFAVDAINLFESGLAALCDTTVGVLAGRETRIARIMARDGLTREYAALRVDAQKPDSFYESHCDWILQNAGTREQFARTADQYLTNILKGAFPMTKQEREALLYQPKHGHDRLTKEDEAAMLAYCEDYKAFLDRSKTERECVVSAVELAEKAGFRELKAGMALKAGDKVYSVNRGKSILLAVMASGFNGQSFAFHGYLPIEPAARAKALKRLESLAVNENQTQLFIETPYRNARMMADIMRACRPQTRLCVAAGLTTPQEYIRTLTVKQWRETKMPELAKVPAIFVLYK